MDASDRRHHHRPECRQPSTPRYDALPRRSPRQPAAAYCSRDADCAPLLGQARLDEIEIGFRIVGEAARYAQMLRDLPAGLDEWAVHPGLGDEESQAVDGGWLVRRTDHKVLTSPQARDVLQQEDITVIDYRTIQQVRFRGTRLR